MSFQWSTLKGRLIVSVQAQPQEPMHGAAHMAAMARAVVEGGADAIRCESPADIAAIREAVSLPLIGLWKVGETGVYITPSREAAKAVAEAGADVIAIDATDRERPVPVAELIAYIHDELKLQVMADVSTFEEGLAAQAAGADAVGTTLSGYTGGPTPSEPDWELLQRLLGALQVPVIMEGRVWTPQQAAKALSLGAWAVVVGSAITRPQLVTKKFAQALQSPAPSLALGIDIGGTKILTALVDASGHVLKQWRCPTDVQRGAKAVMESVEGAIAQAMAELEPAQREALSGIGVSSAGQVDSDAGTVVYASPNIPGWAGTAIADLLRARFGLPVAVDNDGNAAAYGEWWAGAAKGENSLVMLTLGTGVGGGIVLDGRVLRGARWRGGEIGHMIVEANGEPCNCGQTGCLEVYASGTAIARMAGKPAPEVFKAAEAGDASAQVVLERAARYLAVGLVSLTSILDPDVFLLGGGVSTQPGFLPLVRSALLDAGVSGERGFVTEAVRLAALGEAAGAVGAAGLVLKTVGKG